MSVNELANKLKRLGNDLRQVMFHLPIPQDGDEEQKFNVLFNDICQTVFTNDFFNDIWEERILLQLSRLFHHKPPNVSVFGKRLAAISTRTELVRKVNDFFFSVLNSEASPEDVCTRLCALADKDECSQLGPQIRHHLEQTRSTVERTSVKLSSFLKQLSTETEVDLNKVKTALNKVLEGIRQQEKLRGVNALLVDSTSGCGTVIPLRVKLRSGQGGVTCLIPGTDEFQKAIERAREALVEERFLTDTDNVNYSLDVTDVHYVGGSIGLPAAVAMHSARSGELADLYTAFTGDINIEGGRYKVKGVKGISQKLDAASLNGCRRVFIPLENSDEVQRVHRESLSIHCVEDVISAFLKLQKHVTPVGGDALCDKKIAAVRSYCIDQGWELSSPKTIQDGFQLSIAPINPPELKLNIYTSGTHNPKKSDQPHFQELLNHLASLDSTRIQIRRIQEVFNLKDTGLRSLIHDSLDKLGPTQVHKEQYCDYSYEFVDGKEKIRIKQFKSGKLQVQGSAGELYKKALEIVLGLYNTKYPTAKLCVAEFLARGKVEEKQCTQHASASKLTLVAFPHIGTDESGKGDYFGPLVSVGVLVTERTAKQLSSVGVTDSKKLSDKRNVALAKEIMRICRDSFAIIEISPERYNALYHQFRKEKKSLNTLLAWGHAKAIEEILTRVDCKSAVADQFADESFILGKLQERGKQIDLIQMHKAEQNVAVAAASILARARFLDKLNMLSAEYKIEFPKGASKKVIDAAKQFVGLHGEELLGKVAKLHFKTTNAVLNR